MTTAYQTRDLSKRYGTGRWEFDGVKADDEVRERYRNRDVRAYFRRGNQSPTIYVNV